MSTEDKYRYRYQEDSTDIMKCDCCEYPAPVALFTLHIDVEDQWYCEICSSTLISNMSRYPSLFKNVELAKAIAWIGNHILAVKRIGK